jgi:hypothetical protein
MGNQQRQQQADSGDQAGAARHALGDQRQEDDRARAAPEAGETRRDDSDEGSALGPENDDPVAEASAESFPASDPPATSPSTVS